MCIRDRTRTRLEQREEAQGTRRHSRAAGMGTRSAGATGHPGGRGAALHLRRELSGESSPRVAAGGTAGLGRRFRPVRRRLRGSARRLLRALRGGTEIRCPQQREAAVRPWRDGCTRSPLRFSDRSVSYTHLDVYKRQPKDNWLVQMVGRIRKSRDA